MVAEDTILQLERENEELIEKLADMTHIPNVPTKNRFATLVADGPAAIKPATPQNAKLFRGWWDPLSAFYETHATYKDYMYNYKSAEHAYQHQKALFHRHHRGARVITEAPTASQAKTTASHFIPKPSGEKCQKFRDKLLASKRKHLLHNMEIDAKWGCGNDLEGMNRMGEILMDVRETTQTTAHPEGGFQSYNIQIPPLNNVQVTPIHPSHW